DTLTTLFDRPCLKAWINTVTTSDYRSSEPIPAKARVAVPIPRTTTIRVGTSAPTKTATRSVTTLPQVSGKTAGTQKPEPSRFSKRSPKTRPIGSPRIGTGRPVESSGVRQADPGTGVSQRRLWCGRTPSRSAVSPTRRSVAHIRASSEHGGIVVTSEPARGPLPHIAGHIVQPVSIRLKSVCRNSPDRSPRLVGEFPRERVHPRHTVWFADTPPWKRLLFQTAAGRKLPLSFGQQSRTRPPRIGCSIALRNMGDRMIRLVQGRDRRPIGIQPCGPRGLTPPRRGLNGRCSCLQLLGQQTLKYQRIPVAFRIGNVPGLQNEDRKLSIRHGCRRNSECWDRGFADRTFFSVGLLCLAAHQKRTAI